MAERIEIGDVDDLWRMIKRLEERVATLEGHPTLDRIIELQEVVGELTGRVVKLERRPGGSDAD